MNCFLSAIISQIVKQSGENYKSQQAWQSAMRLCVLIFFNRIILLLLIVKKKLFLTIVDSRSLHLLVSDPEGETKYWRAWPG